MIKIIIKYLILGLIFVFASGMMCSCSNNFLIKGQHSYVKDFLDNYNCATKEWSTNCDTLKIVVRYQDASKTTSKYINAGWRLHKQEILVHRHFTTGCEKLILLIFVNEELLNEIKKNTI
jgi:hypothetical protein